VEELMATQRSLTRAEPQNVEEARRAVVESRDRMSDTLDAIEHRLVSKKQEWTDRIDVMGTMKKRIRARPWPAVAAALGVGILWWKLRRGRRVREVEKRPPGKLGRWLKRT
jgi:ElaB/YqjD/DUF883 family membrane-anchored ribosome-binding protein